MNAEELSEAIEEIKRLTPIPGDFIVIRLKHHLGPAGNEALVQTIRSIFPREQRILIVDQNMNLETHFGKCLNCGNEINPNGV